VHPQAYDFIARYATDEVLWGLEFGSKDINGSIQPLFPNTQWYGIDIVPGPRVDLVADAAQYKHPQKVDRVVCCEVFEHTPLWPLIVSNAFQNCAANGIVLFTAASIGRPAHSAVDGGRLRQGEYYENVAPDDLKAVMFSVGYIDIHVEWREDPGDVYAYGVRP
jgi:hypothetical protein